MAPAPQAFPASPPPPPLPTPGVVTAERRVLAPAAASAESGSSREADEVAKAQDRMAQPSARGALGSFMAVPRFAARPLDPATRLRDAAAAGRTSEVETLLDQGAPVDAPDADGNTALIKSVQADHPAAAAALSRHGANLDHRNHAGESARDIATAKDDAALNQAIGLGP